MHFVSNVPHGRDDQRVRFDSSVVAVDARVQHHLVLVHAPFHFVCVHAIQCVVALAWAHPARKQSGVDLARHDVLGGGVDAGAGGRAQAWQVVPGHDCHAVLNSSLDPLVSFCAFESPARHCKNQGLRVIL